MKHYRIGEFAKKLGVTPDFLKYCEKHGLIAPHVAPNGYRYYEFTDAALVLEYLKLRNQGLTAREITAALHESSFDAGVVRSLAQSERLKREIAYKEALIEHAQELDDIRGCFGEKPVWHVRRIPAFYFLQHSEEKEFADGDAVCGCVREWVPYMPVVASAKRLPLRADGRLLAEGEGMMWGLSVDAGFAQRVGLPVDAPVEYVPAQRCLELFVLRDPSQRTREYVELAEDIMRRSGLTPAGDAHCRIVTKLHEGDARREYSVLYVPVNG